MSEQTNPCWSKKEIGLGILAVIITVGLVAITIIYRSTLMSTVAVAGYSLLGMLVVSFLAGSVLSFTAVPVPYWLLVFTLPSALAARWGILSPVAVGLASALGATIGHLPTFMIGYGGRTLSAKITCRIASYRYYTRVIRWAQEHGSVAVFAMSAMFNPIHLPMTVAMGALHYSPVKFFVFSFLGNVVKSLVLAFGGYFGLNQLFRFIGV
ncbi:MAG: VTT domain-containing protein [Chloroflexi bacterium]|nr:VTT domain-containing protein [Chloroflexota bacterium]